MLQKLATIITMLLLTNVFPKTIPENIALRGTQLDKKNWAVKKGFSFNYLYDTKTGNDSTYSDPLLSLSVPDYIGYGISDRLEIGLSPLPVFSILIKKNESKNNFLSLAFGSSAIGFSKINETTDWFMENKIALNFRKNRNQKVWLKSYNNIVLRNEKSSVSEWHSEVYLDPAFSIGVMPSEHFFYECEIEAVAKCYRSFEMTRVALKNDLGISMSRNVNFKIRLPLEYHVDKKIVLLSPAIHLEFLW